MVKYVLLWLLLMAVKGKSDWKSPNVILIVADDLGFHDMPWTNRHVIAPNLKYLAERGTVLNSEN